MRARRRAVRLALLACLLPAATAQAQAPANDNFAAAASLSAETPVLTGSTIEATGEPGEPLHGFGFDEIRSAWVKYTATSSRNMTIGTCGSFSQSVLRGYTGDTVVGLQFLPLNHQDGCSGGAQFTFGAVVGQTYHFAIDGHFGASGSYRIELDPPPVNDARSNPKYLNDGFDAIGETSRATKEPGEADHAGDPGGHSVWFTFYAPTTAPVIVHACGSNFDTILAVYGNGPADDQAIASNDDRAGCGPGGTASRVRFTPPSVGSYLVAVDGRGGASGTYRVGVVTNDDRAGALPIYSRQRGDNTYASAETEEPPHGGTPATHSLWYRVGLASQPGERIAVHVCPFENDFEAVLAAYTEGPHGLIVHPSTEETSTRCGATRMGSSISLVAPDGPLWIAVDGKDGGTGLFDIEVQTTPPNDDRANATELPTFDTSVHTDTWLATKEPAEPDHAGRPGGHSVWYSLTSTESGVVTLDTCFSGFDTLLAVYTEGDEELREVVSNDDAGSSSCGTASRVVFGAAANTRYLIAIDGKGGGRGSSQLRVQHASSTNDGFGNPIGLGSGSSGQISGTTAFATAEPDEPAHAGTAAAHSLWYTLSTFSTEMRALSTCLSSTAPTRIAVYEGDALDTLTVVAEDGPTAGCADGRGARVTWRPPDSAFRTYRIAVDQAGDDAASFQLTHDIVPPNDDRAAARSIFEGSEITSTTAFATRETGEPDHASAGGSTSLWYRWQPHRTSRARLSTCGTTASDTVLAVYTLMDSTLTEITSNDDTPGCGDGRQSRVEFDTEAQATYFVAVDARAGTQGAFRLRSVLRPVNDNRADATDATSGSGFAYIDLATKEPDELDHAGATGGQSVWYRWTARGSGPATIDACSFFGTGIDPVLAVYTEDAGVLQEVASNDNTPGCGSNGTGSRVQFTATAGTQYLVATDSKTSAEGYISVEFPPINDMFAGAITQTSTNFTHHGNLARATREEREPAHDGSPATRSVWFAWTPPRNGQATLDNCQYANTRIAAYTGTDFSDLAAVAERPGSACATGQLGSRLRFEATGQTTYWIAIDVTGTTTSASYGLNARLGPANDAFAEATNTGSSTAVTQSGTTADAGLQDGEPDHAGSGGAASVWYRWTAPRSATLRIDTCSAASFDTAIALYTQQASGVAGLQEVAANDDTSGCGSSGTASRVRVHVDSGTTYWVAVTGQGAAEGSFQLRFALGPFNDDFANAANLTGSLDGHNLDAGDEATEPDHGALGGDRSVWYRFSASDNRNVELRACPTSSSPTPAAAVYTGAALGLLTPAGTGSTRTLGGVSCRVVSLRGAGGQYIAAIDGAAAGQEGTFRVTLAVAAANDDRDRAQQVSGSSTVGGTTFGATPEAGEPEHAGVAGNHSVWYRWTPAHSGPVLMETCASSLDTLLAVYVAVDGGALDPVASSDDVAGCGTGGSRVVFTAQTGTEYLVAVDSKGGAEGPFVLGFPPVNDLFAAATQLSGALVSRAGTVLRAGSEPDEPEHAGTPAARSVWYAWTPPRSARVELSTCLASSAATRVGLYTGDDVDALTSVASAGPTAGCADGQGALLRTRVTGGTTYRIAVDGDPEATFTLQAALAPVNDDRVDAIVLSEPQIVSGTTAFATTEDGEPARAGHAADASVWYRFEATSDGPVTLKTCSSAFATVLGVYDESIAAFHEVASSDDAPGRCANRAALTFDATAATQYLIAVDRRPGGPSGAFELSIGSPANDDIQDAEQLTGEHASGAANTQAATTQDGEPTDLTSAGRRSAWWSWTASASGPIEINTCGSSHQTLLAVYHGAIGALTRDAYNHFGNGCASRSRLTLNAVAGRTYLIAVSSYGGSGGATRLQIGPPANDEFADAEPLDGPEATATGTIAGASAQDSEPSHGDDGERRTIWYSWSAPANGLLTLDSCGSPTPVHIEAYTGGAIFALAGLAEVDSPDACPADAAGRTRTFQVDEGAAYRIALEGSDTTAGSTALRLRLNVDQDPPETTIDDGPAALTNAASIAFAFSSDEPNSTFECRLGSDPFAACESPLDRSSLEDGDYVFEVRATDEAGNTDPDPARLEFTVDRTPPGVSITDGPAEYSNERAATFVFSTADPTAAFECALDGEEFATCASPVTRDELDDGSHSWTVRAIDPAGNTSTDTVAFTVDTVAPTTTLITVPRDPTNAEVPELQFASEDDATFVCSVDGAAFDACESPLALPGLDDGEHTVEVRATDRAGNVEAEPVSVAFTVDRTPPETTITGQPAGPFHEPGSFEFTSSEADGNFECAIDDGDFAPCESGQPLDLAGVPPGDRTFRVRTTDAAGNADPTPATAPFTFENEVPEATLTVTPESGTVELEVAALLQASDADADELHYALDFGDGTRQTGVLPAAGPLTHSYDTPGVFVVRAEVGDGFSSVVVTRTVTVALAEPLQADAGDDLVVAAGAPARLNGGGSRPDIGIDGYGWTFGDGTGASGRAVEHVYSSPGTYDAQLTVSAGSQSDTDTTTVRVLAPAAPAGMDITVQSGGAALANADVLVVTSGGEHVAAMTNALGHARLQGLPDGTYQVLAYRPGYLPGSTSVSQSSGTGQGTISLAPGDVARATISSRPLTLQEVVALGIDPDDPENQHVVEFEIRLNGQTFRGRSSSGGFIGSPSGMSCSRSRCSGGGMSVGHHSLGSGMHGLTTLVIPARARWLKEFFEVSMTVHNMATDTQFVLRNGTARLELPEGLSLAPTAHGEHRSQAVADIAGGENATTTWIIRGDEEGEYLLNADYGATLEPFGRSVSVRAEMQEPMKVWGLSALKVAVETDDEAGAGHPFTARIGLRNVADVPVYNAGIELLPGGEGYVEQPQQRHTFDTAQIAPGETFWSDPLILVPESSGTIDVDRSLVRKLAGHTNLGGEIATRPREPAIEDDPYITSRPRQDSLTLEFEAIPGASAYKVFRLIDREEGFEPDPLPACPPMPDPPTAPEPPAAPCVRDLGTLTSERGGPKFWVGGLTADEESALAISSVIDGTPTMVHPLIEGTPTTDSPYPRITLKEMSRCAMYPMRGEYRFEDPDFPLSQAIETYDFQEREIDLTEPGRSTYITTIGYEFDAVPADDRRVEVVAANTNGETGYALNAQLGQCNRYTALGDSYSSGEGVPPFDLGTANDDDHDDENNNNKCHRSPKAYPRLLANQRSDIEDSPTLVACSGAVTSDFESPWRDTPHTDEEDRRNENEPAQIDELNEGTNLVTLTFGGNDVGFGYIVAGCVELGFLARPFVPCKSAAEPQVSSTISTMRSILAGLYRKVRERAPNARIMVLEYPQIFPASTDDSCEGIDRSDIAWLHRKQDDFNAVLRSAVEDAGSGVELVSMGSAFDDHDVCQSSANSWFNKVNTQQKELSFHPTEEGQHAMALAVSRALANPPEPAFTVAPGGTAVHTATISEYAIRFVVGISWPGSDVELSLTSPSGREIGRLTEAADVEHSVGPTYESFAVDHPEPGEWTIRMFGKDVSVRGEPVGLTVSQDIPRNHTPEAQYVASSTEAQTGTLIDFDGSESFDLDGPISSYEWDFGDGDTGSGEFARHTYTSAGTYDATLIVRDEDGASTSFSGVPIVITDPPDAVSPVLAGVPTDMAVAATGAAGAVVHYPSPTAADAVDGSRPVACAPPSGSTFPIGSTTVTCTASDTSANTTSDSFDITVADETAPAIEGVPSDTAIEATSAAGAPASYETPTGSDLVDGPVAVDCEPASGSNFPLGTTTVNCSAADAAGNNAGGSFDVTVADTTGPVLSGVPADVTAEATSLAGATVTYAPTAASDAVDGRTDIACAPPSGSVFPVGTTTVVCSSEDSRGNPSSASFEVVVTPFVDQPPPPPPPPPPPGPPPPPPPPPIGPPPPPVTSELFPAKLQVLRAGIRGGRLDVFARITDRATGEVDVAYLSSGRTTRFTASISKGTIRINRLLPATQRRKTTGILTMSYAGNDRVRSDEVRLRAASGKALLTRGTTSIDAGGRLRVAGTISKHAAGVVRIRLGYIAPDGSVEFLGYTAKITNGKWSLARALPSAAAKAGGQLSIQYTGYEPRGIRGEQLAKAVAP